MMWKFSAAVTKTALLASAGENGAEIKRWKHDINRPTSASLLRWCINTLLTKLLSLPKYRWRAAIHVEIWFIVDRNRQPVWRFAIDVFNWFAVEQVNQRAVPTFPFSRLYLAAVVVV